MICCNPREDVVPKHRNEWPWALVESKLTTAAFLASKTLKSGNRPIGIKCSPYAPSNKAFATFGSSLVSATLREGTRTLHLHVKI